MSQKVKPSFIIRELKLDDCEQVRSIWTEVKIVFPKYINEIMMKIDPEGILVAEDTETGEVMGTTALDAAVGLSSPFYTYLLGKQVHSSPKLGIYNVVETLTLTNDYTGVSELCTLFLREQARQGSNGRLLSKCRFLFLAEFPELFDRRVLAEMRGVSDDNGNSPFWNA